MPLVAFAIESSGILHSSSSPHAIFVLIVWTPQISACWGLFSHSALRYRSQCFREWSSLLSLLLSVSSADSGAVGRSWQKTVSQWLISLLAGSTCRSYPSSYQEMVSSSRPLQHSVRCGFQILEWRAKKSELKLALHPSQVRPHLLLNRLMTEASPFEALLPIDSRSRSPSCDLSSSTLIVLPIVEASWNNSQ